MLSSRQTRISFSSKIPLSIYKKRTLVKNLSNFFPEKKTVLCVEDDKDNCELIEFVLSDYKMIFADSIKESLELFNSQHIDLCLLDNWLGDGYGTDLCRELRSLNNNVPIVFISGVAQNDEIQKALNAGAQAYLVKPYLPDELQKIVKELIEPNIEN